MLVEYVLDGQSRRVGKKVNGALVEGFLYDGQLRIIAQLNGAGAIVARFVYGTHVNVPDLVLRDGKTYKIIADLVGSPRLIVDTSNGAVAQRLDFDEWGNGLADSNPDFQPFGF